MSTTIEHAHPQLGFIRKYIFSTDHKIIGIQYIITAMFMAVVGGLLSLLMRVQLGWPEAETGWSVLGQIFPGGMPGGFMAPEFYLSLVRCTGPSWSFSSSPPC
jgi:cytochrome c oxidase subunit 1